MGEDRKETDIGTVAGDPLLFSGEAMLGRVRTARTIHQARYITSQSIHMLHPYKHRPTTSDVDSNLAAPCIVSNNSAAGRCLLFILYARAD